MYYLLPGGLLLAAIASMAWEAWRNKSAVTTIVKFLPVQDASIDAAEWDSTLRRVVSDLGSSELAEPVVIQMAKNRYLAKPVVASKMTPADVAGILDGAVASIRSAIGGAS